MGPVYDRKVFRVSPDGARYSDRADNPFATPFSIVPSDTHAEHIYDG